MRHLVQVDLESRKHQAFGQLAARCDAITRDLAGAEWQEWWTAWFGLSIGVHLADGGPLAAKVLRVSNPERADSVCAVVEVRFVVPEGSSAVELTSGLRSWVHEVFAEAGRRLGLGAPPELRATRREIVAGLEAVDVSLTWEGRGTALGTVVVAASRSDLWRVLGASDPRALLSAMTDDDRATYRAAWHELFTEVCEGLGVMTSDGLEIEAMALALQGPDSLARLGQDAVLPLDGVAEETMQELER